MALPREFTVHSIVASSVSQRATALTREALLSAALVLPLLAAALFGGAWRALTRLIHREIHALELLWVLLVLLILGGRGGGGFRMIHKLHHRHEVCI